MQPENSMAFAKTKIICHGARATRIGERLIRQVWKYIKSTDFVKGNIHQAERQEMLQSIELDSIISYPDDIEKTDTNCDIIFQIVLGEREKSDTLIKANGVPNIVFLIDNNHRLDIEDMPYISIEEKEILDTFLDIFSVYTFPQEYGADFEELCPLFEHKGEISTKKGTGFNLCVFRKMNRTHTLDNEIKRIEQEKGNFILVSRIANEDTTKIYSI